MSVFCKSCGKVVRERSIIFYDCHPFCRNSCVMNYMQKKTMERITEINNSGQLVDIRALMQELEDA